MNTFNRPISTRMNHRLVKISKNIFKAGIKIFVSCIALYFVFRKMDIHQLILITKNINWWFFGLAVLFYNLSQITSALRLTYFLRIISIFTSFSYNLKLYYKGMFYNLFLPGGIGGDGVKGYLLTRQFSKPLKQVITVLFLDRLSGFAGLVGLCAATLLFCHFNVDVFWGKYFLAIGLASLYPLYFLFIHLFFKSYKKVFSKTSLLGISVNIVQSVAVLFLFLALHVDHHLIEYMAVFYVADIALLFPFTIGGAGAREMVFLFAPKIIPVDTYIGVTFSLLLFLITVISSMTGVLMKTNLPVKEM
jgi:glycosyltransferase 2 family protein